MSSDDTPAAAATRVLISFNSASRRLLRPPLDETDVENDEDRRCRACQRTTACGGNRIRQLEDQLVKVFGRHVQSVHQCSLDGAPFVLPWQRPLTTWILASGMAWAASGCCAVNASIFMVSAMPSVCPQSIRCVWLGGRAVILPVALSHVWPRAARDPDLLQCAFFGPIGRESVLSRCAACGPSISAAVGFIALFGIAILNGVVMVSYMEERRKEGPPRGPGAAWQAAITQLR